MTYTWLPVRAYLYEPPGRIKLPTSLTDSYRQFRTEVKRVPKLQGDVDYLAGLLHVLGTTGKVVLAVFAHGRRLGGRHYGKLNSIATVAHRTLGVLERANDQGTPSVESGKSGPMNFCVRLSAMHAQRKCLCAAVVPCLNSSCPVVLYRWSDAETYEAAPCVQDGSQRRSCDFDTYRALKY